MGFRKGDEVRIAQSVVRSEQQVKNPHLSRARWFSRKAEKIVAFKTKVAHPGVGIPFAVWVGSWDPEDNNYGFYDETVTVIAVDQRTGAPLPGPCATGWGWWRPSNQYGQIIYIGDIDCISPGCVD